MKTSASIILLTDLTLLLFHPRVDEQFLSASPVSRYLLPLTGVHRRWEKDNRTFSEALFEAGWVLESSQLCFTGREDRGLARLSGPHHHGAGSQGTWAPSSPRTFLTPALHIDNYMQEGPHQEPATAGPLPASSSPLPGGSHSWDSPSQTA